MIPLIKGIQTSVLVIFWFAFHFISGCDVGHCISACPHGWEENGDTCFFWSSAEKNWDDAEAWCKKQDSHLASVPSPSIREYILSSMKRKNINNIWLGGNDIKEEGVWNWNDCTPWKVSFWAKWEPTKSKHENCLTLVLNFPSQTHLNKKWNNKNCDYKLSFLCQEKIRLGQNNVDKGNFLCITFLQNSIRTPQRTSKSDILWIKKVWTQIM